MENNYLQKYSSREEEIRATLSLEEVINIIRTKYAFAEYDPNRPNLDAWDQLLACEALAESAPAIQEEKREMREKKENPSVSGMINDSSKRNAVFELTENKKNVIAELSKCCYKTHPIKIANLLEILFHEWKSKNGHWLYVAQNWTPRAINRVISRLVKLHTSGRITLVNPAAYFTNLIKFRKRKKRL